MNCHYKRRQQTQHLRMSALIGNLHSFQSIIPCIVSDVCSRDTVSPAVTHQATSEEKIESSWDVVTSISHRRRDLTMPGTSWQEEATKSSQEGKQGRNASPSREEMNLDRLPLSLFSNLRAQLDSASQLLSPRGQGTWEARGWQRTRQAPRDPRTPSGSQAPGVCQIISAHL